MRSGRLSRRTAAAVEFTALEPRTMMCAAHDHSVSLTDALRTPAGWTANSSAAEVVSVPVLNSKVGAKATLYLDFDGDVASNWGSYNVTTTPAYSGSAANIEEIWTRVAEKFSSFNINVTTVNPGSFGDKQALHVVIGGAGGWTGMSCGGLSYVGSFSNSSPNTSYVFSENLGGSFPKYVAEAICHESGHAFGLEHQSQYSITHSAGGDTTTKTQEYCDNGGSPLLSPTMGNSYGADRGTWWYGTNSDGAMQDDLSIIAGAANGFGYRSDDHGSSFSTARNMKFSADKRFNIRGIIETPSDNDRFAFTFPGGKLSLKIRGAAYGMTLDSTLRIYRADGTAVAKADSANLAETLTKTLPAGKYYAIVSSKGEAGDVGQYTLIATYSGKPPAAAPMVNPPSAMPRVFSQAPMSGSTNSYEDIEAALAA